MYNFFCVKKEKKENRVRENLFLGEVRNKYLISNFHLQLYRHIHVLIIRVKYFRLLPTLLSKWTEFTLICG